MKTALKIFGILVIFVVVVTIALPFIFKGKLTELALEEINKNLNAKVGFNAINPTLIKRFPIFILSIEGLSFVGNKPFDGDTLAYIPTIGITVDLMSVISGSTYKIKKIKINGPSISVKVLEDGSANYDITLAGEDVEEVPAVADTEDDKFILSLQGLQISDAMFVYDDRMMQMKVSMTGMDFNLSGDFSADQTTFRTNTDVAGLNLSYNGIPYFTNTKLSYEAAINADLKNEIYTLKKNSLFLNELLLIFDGSVSMVNDEINTVLTFNAPKTEFKHILSLVPAIYTRDFADLEASGNLGIEGHIKGLYNETSLPAFRIALEVENGTFKYPALPNSVSHVNILAKVTNKGGDADNTEIDIPKFHLQMGQNPVDIVLHIKTPVSDPDMKGNFKGKIDLSTIKDFYPLTEGENLKGSIIAEVSISGKLSDIENEHYEAFTAIGSLLMQDFEYKNSYTNDPVVISNAQLNFSPQYLDLVSLDCAIGNNDIRANGKINNYLAYTFNKKVLKGNFSTQSKFINLNELMKADDEESVSSGEETDTASISIVEIPGRIDFAMTSTFDQLIYDNFEMENVNGKLHVKDNRLTIHNLSMNILDGEMVVSGEYNTVVPDQPEFDFDLNISNIDIQRAYNTFGILSQYAPIARKTSGKFSSSMNMQSILDQQMMPVYEAMTGGGKLQTTRLTIQDVNTLDKIAEVLKYDALKNMTIDKILLQFEFVDGKILIEPFDFNQNNFSGQMAGWTGLDQSIDYTMDLKIPRESFGNEANAVLNNLVSQANSQGANFSLGETVSLDVLIGGTLSNPEIKTNLKETGKNLVEDVKKQVEEEIQKQKEELTKQAREQAQEIIDEADKQAERLIKEAEKQAKNLRKTAGDASNEMRNEADKQAKKVEAEGKKNGFLAEVAAKETAKQIRKEADKQATKLESEADKQSKEIIKKANNEASAIKRNARTEADKILGEK